MNEKGGNPFGSLEKIFHEPSRLAIMSALCGAGADGATFNELKERCDLTDGNLSRHIRALDECGLIRVKKEFVDAKPRTTVFTSEEGVSRFVEYLDHLESALKAASKAASARERKTGGKRMFKGFARKPSEA